jgi:hypothetical protein
LLSFEEYLKKQTPIIFAMDVNAVLKENFAKGRKYLEKVGTDVIAIAMGMKMVMKPGSAYEDVKKERLPAKFIVPPLNNEMSFSKNFVKEFKVTHEVDLERLLRGCSILITGFEGPEKDDNMKNHHRRLGGHFVFYPSPIEAAEDMTAAMKLFGEIAGVNKKKIDENEYAIAADIVNSVYKIWDYSAPSPFGF